jgi:D-3-phosphoglycerate dehydrogenase
MKIALLEGIHSVAKENLSQQGHEVELFKSSYAEQELIDLLKDFEAVGIRSKTQMTEKVLQHSSHLNAIGCFCIGTNQVDLNTSKSLGIPVFNAPHSNTRSVAELVLCEVVALSRNLFDLSSNVHKGIWQKSASGSFEVRGKTIGIVGYGHIGSQVSILAEAFGLKVLYYDIVKKLPLGNSSQVESLDELLAQSDFVTLHVPETPETQRMFTAEMIAKMKPGSYLINASRGTVVDLKALQVALEKGDLAGAAVDVYPSEPEKNSEGFETNLQNTKNVILTPHIGEVPKRPNSKLVKRSPPLSIFFSMMDKPRVL